VHFLPDTLEGSLQIPRFLDPLVSWYVITFYNRMDQLVVVNPSFIDDLVEYGISRDKITYLPNFVNRDQWHPLSTEEVQDVRKHYAISPDQFVVLGAGQVQRRKGIDDFAQLARECPDVTFVWAGGFSFGNMTNGHAEYKKLMEQPPKNLVFTGIVEAEEMLKLYNMADVFFLPSYSELFPMTILEAASCGTAIMLRDIDLYKVILEGMYLPVKNMYEMKTAIETLQNQPNQLVELTNKAREISNYYSPESLLEKWLAFYQEQADLAKS
jgi:1,2-diacylglycerol-3-alpha-glucose alpha-1,2-galactosyltransferase